MRVLVTNAKNRIAYNIMISLAQKGVAVFCADSVPVSMSFYSKWSSGHFIYPSPFNEQDKFIECIIDKCKSLKIDVLIPVFEELYLISKHKSLISKYVKIVVPDYSKVLTAHNKDQWEPIAGLLRIPVPRSFDIEKYVAEPEGISEIPFPVVVKPKQGGGGWGIRQVGSAVEFRDYLAAGAHEGLPWKRFLVQEMIEGDTVCVAMVFCRGQLRGKVAYRQIREYPAFAGQATCRISISNPTAEWNLQQLLEKLAWHGVCQADFVVCKVTKVPYLVDMNPRFWGSLAQGIASGVDFPYLIYQIAMNGDVESIDGFQEGVVTRWVGGELRGFFQHYLQAREKLPFLRNFFFPEISTAMLDDFSFRDPVPFFAWGLDSFYKIAKFKQLRPHESLSGVWE